jgi:hypothetical protein
MKRVAAAVFAVALGFTLTSQAWNSDTAIGDTKPSRGKPKTNFNKSQSKNNLSTVKTTPAPENSQPFEIRSTKGFLQIGESFRLDARVLTPSSDKLKTPKLGEETDVYIAVTSEKHGWTLYLARNTQGDTYFTTHPAPFAYSWSVQAFDWSPLVEVVIPNDDYYGSDYTIEAFLLPRSFAPVPGTGVAIQVSVISDVPSVRRDTVCLQDNLREEALRFWRCSSEGDDTEADSWEDASQDEYVEPYRVEMDTDENAVVARAAEPFDEDSYISSVVYDENLVKDFSMSPSITRNTIHSESVCEIIVGGAIGWDLTWRDSMEDFERTCQNQCAERQAPIVAEFFEIGKAPQNENHDSIVLEYNDENTVGWREKTTNNDNGEIGERKERCETLIFQENYPANN